MAKSKSTAPVLAMLAVFAPGFETLQGKVEQTAVGFNVTVKPSRKKHLEVTNIPAHVVVAAATGDEGYVVFATKTASVTNHEVDVNSIEYLENGATQFTTSDGETLTIAQGLEYSLYHEQDSEEEAAPASKAKPKAKPKAKVVEEEDEDEDEDDSDDEDEDDEEEEEEEQPKSKAKSKTKSKPKAKVVEEDDEDEDDEEEEDEPKAKSKSKSKPKAKSKAKAKDEDEDDEDDEDEIDF